MDKFTEEQQLVGSLAEANLYFSRLKVVYSRSQINTAKLTLRPCQDNNDKIDDHSRELELDLLPLQDTQHIPTYLVQILDF